MYLLYTAFNYNFSKSPYASKNIQWKIKFPIKISAQFQVIEKNRELTDSVRQICNVYLVPIGRLETREVTKVQHIFG